MSPVEDMIRVNAELSLFDSALAQKPQLIVVNKIDLPQVQARLAEIEVAFSSAGTIPIFVSAVTGEGVAGLMAETMEVLQSVAVEGGVSGKGPLKVFRPQPRSVGSRVHKEGNTFVVVAPELERIVIGMDVTSPVVRWQLKRQLSRMGVSKALERAGVKPGDRVRCGDFEWDW
ncbi:unnamed protein product [marine sediment metagenome]|uniref:OCT domain-containing protein n=1 Tax=marine sediment metagenome TaxID=412755 RepID=X1E4U1_9ZZZZ